MPGYSDINHIPPDQMAILQALLTPRWYEFTNAYKTIDRMNIPYPKEGRLSNNIENRIPGHPDANSSEHSKINNPWNAWGQMLWPK